MINKKTINQHVMFSISRCKNNWVNAIDASINLSFLEHEDGVYDW